MRRSLREDGPAGNKLELSTLVCASQVVSSHEEGILVRTRRLPRDTSAEEMDRIPAEERLPLRLRSTINRKLSKLDQK